MQRIFARGRRLTLLGVAVAAAAAIGGAEAGSVSANGHEFIASKTGKVTSKYIGEQTFKTSGGTIECTGVTGTGTVTELESPTHKEVLTYTGCTGFGVGIKISAAHFEMNANGSERLEKVVTVTPEGLSCEVLIPAQTFEGMKYTNDTGGKVTAAANVSNITIKGTGGMCGGENSESSYTGSMKAEIEGGTLEWK